MKIFKFAVIFLCIVFAVCFVVTAGMMIKENVYDFLMNDNTNSLIHNVKYRESLKINGVPVIKQQITCGYASIEMIAKYFGYDNITEQSIYDANGEKITTMTNKGFYEELKKQFPDYSITQCSNLKNTEMIDKIYISLANKIPVITSFAAVDKTLSEDSQKWTLHYGVIVGIDMENDEITVNNPYGYTDKYSLSDFLKSTRFANYENMEFYYKLGFSYGLFTKNTLYIIEKTENVKSENID